MKYIVILITALFLGTSIQATEKAPIMPRKANNGEYTRAESEAVATGDGQISIWWRTNLLMLVNRGLTASGTGIKVDESNIHWIFEHITYDFKDLGPYINSRLSDGTPEWFTDKDGWSGNVAIFRYMTCTIILYKTQCLNLLDIPVKVTTPPAAPYVPPVVVGKKDTIYIQTVSAPQPICITIENNNTNTNTNGQPASEVKYVVGEEEQYVPQPQPVYYNQRPMMRPRPQVRLSFSVRGGRQQQVYQPAQQRGYMGGGRPAAGQGQMGGGSGNGNNNGNQGGGRPY